MQIRRTLSSSSICLETFSASGSWGAGPWNVSVPERGLRAMGYRVAVWDWQWQSRWLIARTFIRDGNNAASRSQALADSHQTTSSHEQLLPGRPMKHLPSMLG